MSLKITDDCTSCDACVTVCPNAAISEGDIIYVIDPDRCTECVGTDESPQCQHVCPADAIIAGLKESNEDLLARYRALHA